MKGLATVLCFLLISSPHTLTRTPELYYDRGNHHEFATLVKELAAPGDLMKSTVYDFEFHNVEKQHETYTGINVRLR